MKKANLSAQIVVKVVREIYQANKQADPQINMFSLDDETKCSRWGASTEEVFDHINRNIDTKSMSSVRTWLRELTRNGALMQKPCINDNREVRFKPML